MEELVRIMSAAGAERLAGQYGVSAGVNVTGVLAWSAKRKMARLYHADLAELAWARYDKVTVQASVPGADGQQLGAGAEEQLDNRPDPRAREAYAFFQHGATETAGGCVDGWGARATEKAPAASEGLGPSLARVLAPLYLPCVC